jgi:hypothetical protein
MTTLLQHVEAINDLLSSWKLVCLSAAIFRLCIRTSSEFQVETK